MKNNEVLEELFAAEEAAMGSLHPTEEAVRELTGKLKDFHAATAERTTDFHGQIEEIKNELSGRIAIAQDLYQDLEPSQRESETGKTLQDAIDTLEAQLRGITGVSDAFADLKLLFS